MLEAGTQCKLSRIPWNPAVVDVPVIMQLQFQRFLAHEREGALGHRLSDFLLCNRDGYSQCKNVQKVAEIPQVQFLGCSCDHAAPVQLDVPQILDRVYGGGNGDGRRCWFFARCQYFRTPSIWTSSPGFQESPR